MSYITIYFGDKPVYLTDTLDNFEDERHQLKDNKEVVYMEGISTYNLQSMPAEIAKPGYAKGIIFHNDLQELQKVFFSQFKIIRAGGGLVRNEKDEILLILRKNKWDLPKGKLDPSETIEECAVREVKEETGLSRVDLVKSIEITYHTYVEKGTLILKESHWYEMKSDSSQELIPQTEEEISEIKWVAVNDIPEYLKNSYGNIIKVLKSYLDL